MGDVNFPDQAMHLVGMLLLSVLRYHVINLHPGLISTVMKYPARAPSSTQNCCAARMTPTAELGFLGYRFSGLRISSIARASLLNPGYPASALR